jgi:hypothetical protein
MYLGAVAGKITHQSPIEELDIHPLLAYRRPPRASKSAEPRPVLDFEISHAVKKDIQGDPKKAVSDDNIRVAFMHDSCTSDTFRSERMTAGWVLTQKTTQKHSLVDHRCYSTLFVRPGPCLEVRREPIERPDEGMDTAW